MFGGNTISAPTVIGTQDGRWYIGQAYQDEQGTWLPYNRLSEYFATEEEANQALTSGYTERAKHGRENFGGIAW